YLYDGTSNITINWTAKGTVTPVRIEYSLDNDTSPWGEVNGTVTGVQGYNEYEWPIPDERSQECLVRAYDNRTAAWQVLVNDTSDAVFRILPKLNLTAPDLDDNIFAHASNASITWDYTGTKIKNITLEYSTGGAYSAITGAESVNVTYNANFTWPTVPTLTSASATIRINDKNASYVNNTTPVFNIVGSVVLSSPNGGENWTAGSSRTVSWTRYAINTLNISYYNGSAWNNINDSFDTSDDANQSTSWSIDPSASLTNNSTVRVQDVLNPSVSTDVSNSSFNITAALDITQPETSSDVFIAEEEHYITWTKTGTGLATVKLEYSTAGGADGTWSNVDDACATVSNNGNYTWASVNGTNLSDNCIVRISDPGKLAVNSSSSSASIIRGKLDLTRPVEATENWRAGTTQEITWESKGNMDFVDIYYYNGTGWAKINANPVTCSDHSWNWTINQTTVPSGAAKISVNYTGDPTNVSSASPSAFTVSKLMVGSPNGGQNWKAADIYEITWTAANISKVHVNYSIDGGAWAAVPGAENITASDQSFNWTISNYTAISNNVLIRVMDASNDTVNDTSNASFAIIPNLTITNPQGGIPLYAEEWYKINWTRTGCATTIGSVKLEYRTSEIGAYLPINNSTTSVPTYNWSNIPGDVLSDACWVKITSLGNENATDES
ncbi:MAG: hypothetical protein AAB403_11850, partial [Planctomycetota bacterium]